MDRVKKNLTGKEENEKTRAGIEKVKAGKLGSTVEEEAKNEETTENLLGRGEERGNRVRCDKRHCFAFALDFKIALRTTHYSLICK